MPFITQGKTNWKFLLIVIILAVIVGGWILWCMTKEKTPDSELLEEKEAGESLTLQQLLSDKEVNEILREFAEKETVRFNDIGADKVLLDALEFKNGEIKNRLQSIKINIENLSNEIQDAPDMRSWFTQRVKTCIAESIIYNDIKSILKYCGYKESAEPINLTSVDDLTATEQILPYFIAGFVYYSENDYPKADYYYGQIKLHRAELEKYGYGNEPYLELYNRICSKAKVEEVKISEQDKTTDWKAHISEEAEFLDIDEEITADWKTYTNKNYNYQLKIPNNWGQINVYDGSVTPEINPYNDHYAPLGAEDGSEQIAVGHFRDTDKHSYSIDWYINFYINNEYQVKLIKTKYCDIAEIYIPEINERLATSNKYTYLIEKDDYLFEVGFLNKNSITEQIIANLKFLD
jgi:hypothetical protein